MSLKHGGRGVAHKRGAVYQIMETETPSGELRKRRKQVRERGSQVKGREAPSTRTRTGSAGRRMRVTFSVFAGALHLYEKVCPARGDSVVLTEVSLAGEEHSSP